MISASSTHEAGHSLVLCDNPEGWGGERDEKGFRMGRHMYGKNQHNIVKKKYAILQLK